MSEELQPICCPICGIKLDIIEVNGPGDMVKGYINIEKCPDCKWTWNVQRDPNGKFLEISI